jgi:hypothetical protein
MAELILKFRNSADSLARKRLLDGLPELIPGVRVQPLFEGETDPELASLYRVTLASPDQLSPALRILQESPAVEYAHEPRPRELR